MRPSPRLIDRNLVSLATRLDAATVRLTASLSWTIRLSQVNAALTAVEVLLDSQSHVPSAVAERARPISGFAPVDQAVAFVLEPKWDRVSAVSGLIASCILICRPKPGGMSASLLALGLGTSIRTYARNGGFGRDGSDHAGIVQQSGLLAAVASQTEGVRAVALGFIGLQGLLAYFTSGMVKVVSPVWRDGRAMTGVLRTESYGDANLHSLLAAHPSVARIFSWGVMASELSVPLIPLLPNRFQPLSPAALLAMHAAIARFMGLNRFFWAFAAMHPAMRALTLSLSRG